MTDMTEKQAVCVVTETVAEAVVLTSELKERGREREKLFVLKYAATMHEYGRRD